MTILTVTPSRGGTGSRGRSICGVCIVVLLGVLAQSRPASAQIEFIRGDVNGDGRFDLADPIATLFFLFRGTFTIHCLDAADVNDDGDLDASDPIYSLNALFRGLRMPPAPHPDPGVDPTDDGLGCGEASTQISATIESSRVRGVAPLAVFFDATGTTSDTSARPFHELRFQWDFGDPGSGAWPTDGSSRNVGYGPLVGHVFDDPGEYVVQLAVNDASGNFGSSSVRIIVDDPDAVYAGEATICFSQSGDFSGAPVGARLVQTSGSFDEVLSRIADDRRLLLRRGESWSTSDSFAMEFSGGTLGAFGSGPRPVIRMTGSRQQLFLYGRFRGEPSSDWRYVDLEIDGGSLSGTIAFNRNSSAPVSRDLLFYRLSVHDCGGGGILPLSQNPDWPDGDSQWPLGTAIVACEIFDNGSSSGGNCVLAEGTSVFLAGNTMRGSPGGGHVVRFGRVQKAAVLHNRFSYTMEAAQVLLRVTASRYTGEDSMTRHVVIADNGFDGASGPGGWLVEIAGIDNNSDFRLEDVIVERNWFRFSDRANQTTRSLRLSGRDFTIRNNVFHADDTRVGGNFINIWKQSSSWDNERINVHNNTGYAGSQLDVTVHMIYFGDGSSRNCDIRNNLFYNASGGGGEFIARNGIDTTRSNNLQVGSSPAGAIFVSSAPSTPADFRLSSGSPASDAGVAVPGVYEDFAGGVRPTAGPIPGNPAVDIGAFERQP